MIEITDKYKYDLNNMNVAGQQIQLGDFLSEVRQNTSGSAGNIISGSSKFGNDTDYATFDSEGFLTLSGSARYWDDMFFPLTQGKVGALDKPDFDYGVIAYMFPQNDASEIMYVVAQFPHSWAIGTDIHPHVHWKQYQSGAVVFKIDYKWFEVGNTIPTVFSTYVMDNHTQTYTSGSILQINSGSAPISGSSITTVSSMMLMKLYRDDNTFTGDAPAYQLDIHILRDTLGSQGEYSK